MERQISIVIPIYNVEAYLEECFDSVLAQALDTLEVVCVNDGSTDRSQAIIEKYCSEHEHWSYVVQTNQGLSMARNNGLKRAQGVYVFFLDSDDFLEPDVLGAALKQAFEQDLDILDIKVCSYLSGKRTPWNEDLGNPRAVPETGRDYLVEYIGKYNRQPSVSAWSHLFRRTFLLDHRMTFLPGRYYEDLPFTLESYLLASRVNVNDRYVYNYRLNMSSITKSAPKVKHVEDLLHVSQVVANIACQHRVHVPMENFFHAILKSLRSFATLGRYREVEHFLTPDLFRSHRFLLKTRKSRWVLFLLKTDAGFGLFKGWLLLLSLAHISKAQ